MILFNFISFITFFLFVRLYKADITPHPEVVGWYDSDGRISGVGGDVWVPINHAEALDYYTAHEVCYLSAIESCGNEPDEMRECSANSGRNCRCVCVMKMFVSNFILTT